jgi:hypothetical protein
MPEHPTDKPQEGDAPKPTDATKPDGKPADGTAGGNLDDLPQWARDAITSANREAAGYRTKVRELEPLADKAKQLEDAGKTEAQRLAEDRDSHKSRADTAQLALLRLEVAIDKGLTKAQAKRLVGTTREELEADADELVESFRPAGGTGDKPKPRSSPKERLRGGGDPNEEPEESDPRKLAAKVPRF